MQVERGEGPTEEVQAFFLKNLKDLRGRKGGLMRKLFALTWASLVYQMDVKSALIMAKLLEDGICVSTSRFYRSNYHHVGLQSGSTSFFWVYIKIQSLDKYDIILVQSIVDDIIFGSTKNFGVMNLKASMKKIRKKVDFIKCLRLLVHPIEIKKPLSRNDGSLRDVVNPKYFPSMCCLRKFFKVSKGQPYWVFGILELSSFDLESYSDMNIRGANLDGNQTTGGALNHIDDNVDDLTNQAFDVKYVSLIGFKESLRRVIDGTKALLLPTLFILWLDTDSTDSAKLVPLGKVCTAIETLKKNTAKALISLLKTITLLTTMAILYSCPKHNMVAYLEKSEGNAEFHEIIDFLTRSSIHHALTVSPVVSTTFVEQFWTSAKSKIINNVRHITAKVAGKPVSISEASIRSDLLFDDANGIDSLPNQAIFDAIQLMGYEGDLTTDPSPTHSSDAPFEPQTDPSPRPSPSTIIPDSIPDCSGGNLGGHSSSDKSLSGNEGEMTLQSVYDLCISLCTQVSDQAKKIQHLKAQIKKLKKQAKLIVKHHRAWMKSVSLRQRLARKRSSKKQWVHRESVSKQGRKFAKGKPTVHKDPLFDEIPEDSLDYMETEDAQDDGRTRDVVDEEKENAEDVLSNAQHKVSTDRPIVSTDGSKVSIDRQKDSTDEQSKGIDDHTEEGSATQTTQQPTSKIFGDDETIAQVLLNMSKAKAVSREKEKGVEFKDIEETERPRPTSTRSLLTLKPLSKIDPKDKGKKKIEKEDESESESDGIPKAEKKFKQLASDEEMDRKVQEEWENEEERNRLAEEEATNDALIRNYDDIKA
ncbi:hypothetical protein Tco_0570302, partial [Tanacetum coccineum]